MLCTNCGKDIPFVGNVCPWCHANKSGDQGTVVLGLIGSAIGAGLGYLIGGIMGGVVGWFVGIVVGVVFGDSLKGKQDAQAKANLHAKEAIQQKAYTVVAQLASPAVPAASPETDDGEGEYEIIGVDKESKYDTVWKIHAMNRANAKVKAELEGIIVTSVTREANESIGRK